jgi:hypothetical protein
MYLPRRHGRTERVTERVPDDESHDESIFFTERVADESSDA